MFKASLFIFEREYPLIDYEIGSYQPADSEGLPNCRVVLDKVSFSYASVKNDIEFLAGAVSGQETVSGYIRVYKRDGHQKFTDYQFANAYVLKFRETFNSVGDDPTTTHVKIGVGILKRDNHIFENYWNPSNPYGETGEVTTIEEPKEPSLLGYHIEDLQKKVLKESKIKENQEIFLVIKSENTEGEVADIDLENDAIDFEYKGKWMKDDIITDIILNDNLTKVKLKAVKQKEN